MLITIKNEYLTARISDLGAELKSLRFNDEEYIWQGDKKFWEGSSPVLFPICSGLIDDSYFYEGKEYHMPKHGFAKEMIFKVEEKNESSVTFLLTDTNDTIKVYPFNFELRITYSLKGKKTDVKYEVKNTGSNHMFFSIGAHEGYFCPEGINDYELIFPKKTTLYHTYLTDNFTIGTEKKLILDDNDILPLNYEYFKEDALIFENIDFEGVILKNRNNDKKIKVTFKDFPYLLLWTVPDAPYICIEPWCGITDRVGCARNIKTKEGIIALKSGEVFVREHSFEII